MAKRELDIVLNGKDRVSTTLGRVEQRLGKFMKVAGAAAAAATAAASVAIASGIREQLAAVDSLAKSADRLGLTTEALAGLQHGAKLAGVEVGTLEMAMQRMTRRVAEAAQGQGSALSALAELNLDAERLNQLAPDAALRRIADAMSDVQGEGDRVRLAFKLFDSEGVGLLNLIEDGADGIREASAEARELGLTMSRDTAAGIEAANDASERFEAAWRGITRQLAAAAAPLMEGLAELVVEQRKVLHTDPITTAFSADDVKALPAAMRERARDLRDELARLEHLERQIATALVPETAYALEVDGVLVRLEGRLQRAAAIRMELESLESEAADFAAGPRGPGVLEKVGASLADQLRTTADAARQAMSGMAREIATEYRDARLEMNHFAEDVERATRTPMETLQAEVDKLKLALAGGFLGDETFQRGIQRAIRQFHDETRDGASPHRHSPGGPTLDTNRFTTGIGNRQREDRRAEQALRLAKETAAASKEQAEATRELLDRLGVPTPVVLGLGLN
jgi:hypothetical protein